MVKYVRYTKQKNEFTTLSFRDIGVSECKITFYEEVDVVKLEGELNDMDFLVSSQQTEIQAVEITDAEFFEIVKNTKQFLREKELLHRTKIETLEKMTVELNGKIFSVDDKSRARISEALMVAEIAGATESIWKLHKSTLGDRMQIVSVEEMKQVLVLGMQKLGSVVLGDEAV